MQLVKMALFFFVLFGFHSRVNAQQLSDSYIFVWDFYTANGKKNDLTKKLSESTEEILVELGFKCLIRKDYGDLSAMVEMVKSIENTEEIPIELRLKLSYKSAKYVVIGKEVEVDFNGNVKVRISFNDLESGQMTIVKTILLPNGTAFNLYNRKEILKRELDWAINGRSESDQIKDSTDEKHFIKAYAAFELAYSFLQISTAEQENDKNQIRNLQGLTKGYRKTLNIKTDLPLRQNNIQDLASIIYSTLNSSTENYKYLAYFELPFNFMVSVSAFRNKRVFSEYHHLDKILMRAALPVEIEDNFRETIIALENMNEISENAIKEGLEALNEIREYLDKSRH